MTLQQNIICGISTCTVDLFFIPEPYKFQQITRNLPTSPNLLSQAPLNCYLDSLDNKYTNLYHIYYIIQQENTTLFIFSVQFTMSGKKFCLQSFPHIFSLYCDCHILLQKGKRFYPDIVFILIKQTLIYIMPEIFCYKYL